MIYVHCLLRFGYSDLAKQILTQMKERVEGSLLIGEKEKRSFEDFRMTVENEKSKLSSVQSVWIVCCDTRNTSVVLVLLRSIQWLNLIYSESNKIWVVESIENLRAGSFKIGILIISIPVDFILRCHWYFFITDTFLRDLAKHKCCVYYYFHWKDLHTVLHILLGYVHRLNYPEYKQFFTLWMRFI